MIQQKRVGFFESITFAIYNMGANTLFMAFTIGNTPADPSLELIPRSSLHSPLVLVLLISCIFFVSLARLRQRELFAVLGQNALFFRTLEEQQKDGKRVSFGSSWLLIVQFALITSGATYWYYFNRTPIENWVYILLPLLAPTIYLIYQLVIVRLTGFITGSKEFALEINYYTLNTFQVVGILLLLEFFFSYFQPQWIGQSQFILLITYLVFLLIRFLRGFLLGLQFGISWYYLILYFWTLEILPLLVIARLLYKEEVQIWLG
jgi:hypothetical protein